jgi:hypothetical protein
VLLISLTESRVRIPHHDVWSSSELITITWCSNNPADRHRIDTMSQQDWQVAASVDSAQPYHNNALATVNQRMVIV